MVTPTIQNQKKQSPTEICTPYLITGEHLLGTEYCTFTVKRPGLFELSLVNPVAIRKHAF